MLYTINDGVRINYKVKGEGSPTVPFYGLFGSLEQWRILGYVEAPKDNYQRILIDARKHIDVVV